MVLDHSQGESRTSLPASYNSPLSQMTLSFPKPASLSVNTVPINFCADCALRNQSGDGAGPEKQDTLLLNGPKSQFVLDFEEEQDGPSPLPPPALPAVIVAQANSHLYHTSPFRPTNLLPVTSLTHHQLPPENVLWKVP